MNQLSGIKVVIAPRKPRYVLPDDLPLPPLFRESFNSWSEEYLGNVETVADGVAVRPDANTMVVNARTYAVLRQALSARASVEPLNTFLNPFVK